MKQVLNLVVSIEFDEPITSESDIKEVVNHVATALSHQADTSYLSPKYSDAVAKEITVATLGGIAAMGKIRKTIKLR